MTTMWEPDIVDGFEARTINLADEDDGELLATLIRKTVPGGSQRCVVHVHGFSDYFFHPHLAAAYVERGYDFYAVDLRRCGRSYREGNRRNYFDDVADLYVELAETLRIVTGEEGHSHVTLHGHSMGGLVCALFVDDHPAGSDVDLLALNSPWLDVRLPPLQRLMWALTRHFGQRFPHKAIPGGTAHYVESIHDEYRGEWSFDLDWKPRTGEVVYPGWARAVARAQAQVHQGLDIGVPTLVQHSDRSLSDKDWSDELMVTDGVLDVDQIHKWAPSLGPNVTIHTINGGMHDLTLSAAAVRAQMFDRLFAWIDSHS